MTRRDFLKAMAFVTAAVLTGGNLLHAQQPDHLPNILFILADDLGYGDISCYNPESKVQTPILDKLAADGMRFTDAHSPATVCTPTRYSILTGRMQFRTGKPNVFDGIGGPCLIEKGRLTLPQMLRGRRTTTTAPGHGAVLSATSGKEDIAPRLLCAGPARSRPAQPAINLSVSPT